MPETEHDRLAARIKAAKAARTPPPGRGNNPSESPAIAGNSVLKYGSELFANVIVGLGLGLMFDHFFNTRPWGTLIMLALGLVAGFLGVIRAYKQINADLARQADEHKGKD